MFERRKGGPENRSIRTCRNHHPLSHKTSYHLPHKSNLNHPLSRHPPHQLLRGLLRLTVQSLMIDVKKVTTSRPAQVKGGPPVRMEDPQDTAEVHPTAEVHLTAEAHLTTEARLTTEVHLTAEAHLMVVVHLDHLKGEDPEVIVHQMMVTTTQIVKGEEEEVMTHHRTHQEPISKMIAIQI